MVVDQMTIFTQRERWRGFCDALAAAGQHDRRHARPLRRPRRGRRGAGRRRSCSRLPAPPTAIFAANNRITIGVLRALAAHGVDVEVVGFDDLELAELLARPPSTVSYDAADLGREAARLLAAPARGRRRARRSA